jgi:hypothetical protein
MAQTPEGRVKKKVSDFLKSVDNLYYFMPVPSGYGESTLDYLGCYRGKLFAIETKAPGKKPTSRQETTIRFIRAAGGKVFVIDGDITELTEWIKATTQCQSTSRPPMVSWASPSEEI